MSWTPLDTKCSSGANVARCCVALMLHGRLVVIWFLNVVFSVHLSHHGSPQAPHKAQDCQKENQEVHPPPV